MGSKTVYGFSWYAAFLALVFAAPSTLFAQQEYALLTPEALVKLTNVERREESLALYRVNTMLAAAAEEKAKDMATRGYFSHATPEGEKTWRLVRDEGYQFSRVGENLAVKFSDPERIVSSWLASPGHRANLLNEKFVDIGVGLAEGMYQGATTTFVVALFAAPLPSAQDEGEVKGEQELPKESAGLMASFEPEIESESQTDESEELPAAVKEKSAPQQTAAVSAGTIESFRLMFAKLFQDLWALFR